MLDHDRDWRVVGFSTLQRVEIAEIRKLDFLQNNPDSFSTLQRVEIAEIPDRSLRTRRSRSFQYSSTSRNC